MSTTYDLGCVNQHGQSFNDKIPIGPRKNRIFNPALNHRFISDTDMPSDIIEFNSKLEINQLCDSDLYNSMLPGKNERLAPPRVHRDTLVIEIGAKKSKGHTIGARCFGFNSEHNRVGMPSRRDTVERATIVTACLGCQQAEKLIEKTTRIKQVVFITSLSHIVVAMSSIWDWFAGEFPSKDSFPLGVTKKEYLLLHHNVKILEEKGISVQFWEVDPELIVAANWLVLGAIWEMESLCDQFQLDLYDDAALAPKANPSTGDCENCPNCITKRQRVEKVFASTGKLQCDCENCRKMLDIHEDKINGDYLMLTNNAGLDIKLPIHNPGSTVGSKKGGKSKEKDSALKNGGHVEPGTLNDSTKRKANFAIKPNSMKAKVGVKTGVNTKMESA